MSTAGEGHECGESSSPRCKCKGRSETECGADTGKPSDNLASALTQMMLEELEACVH